jgi:hypothetical protein
MFLILSFIAGYFARPYIDALWTRAEEKEPEINNDD